LYANGDSANQTSLQGAEMLGFQAANLVDAQKYGDSPLSFPIPYRATVLRQARPIA
jgi:hypothetical protein